MPRPSAVEGACSLRSSLFETVNLDRHLLAAGVRMSHPHSTANESASQSRSDPNSHRVGNPMTTLVCLTIAIPVVLFAALLPALLLQRFVARSFPAQEQPPAAPPVVTRLPARAAMHTSG